MFFLICKVLLKTVIEWSVEQSIHGSTTTEIDEKLKGWHSESRGVYHSLSIMMTATSLVENFPAAKSFPESAGKKQAETEMASIDLC